MFIVIVSELRTTHLHLLEAPFSEQILLQITLHLPLRGQDHLAKYLHLELRGKEGGFQIQDLLAFLLQVQTEILPLGHPERQGLTHPPGETVLFASRERGLSIIAEMKVALKPFEFTDREIGTRTQHALTDLKVRYKVKKQ